MDAAHAAGSGRRSPRPISTRKRLDTLSASSGSRADAELDVAVERRLGQVRRSQEHRFVVDDEHLGVEHAVGSGRIERARPVEEGVGAADPRRRDGSQQTEPFERGCRSWIAVSGDPGAR
jgi:hypothetical protein